jgi:hypothetical protein
MPIQNLICVSGGRASRISYFTVASTDVVCEFGVGVRGVVM